MSDSLIDFHRELSEQDFYLGRRDIAQKVVWKKIDNAAFITSEAAAAEYDAAWAAYKTASDRAGRAAASMGVGSYSIDMEMPQLEVAELTLVAEICPSNCYLMPWVWTGPTKFSPTLADMPLNCRLIAPVQAPFDQDFVLGLQNLQTLMDIGATEERPMGTGVTEEKFTDTGATEEKNFRGTRYATVGIFDPNENPRKSIKLRHVVFERKNKGEQDDDNAFRLCDWPVKRDAAHADLAEMIMNDSHRVHPLPAYDVGGNFIAPADCARALAGAVVRATISLQHWRFPAKKEDRYVANIERLRVIIPAPQVPSSPRKRKAPPATDDGPSPIKMRTLE